MVLGGGAGPADKPRPRVLSFASAVRAGNNGSWQGSHKVVERVDAAEEEVELALLVVIGRPSRQRVPCSAAPSV